MERAKQITIIKRLLDPNRRSEIDGSVHEIDVDRYTNPSRWLDEKETLFKKMPVVVGAASDLDQEGDYFLFDGLDVPIVIVKGKDGEIRAFVNRCQHRGVKLLTEEKGTIKRNIVCPYHAWTYGLDGCLKSVFHPEGFATVTADSHRLTALDCWVRFGMIFVVADAQSRGTILIDDWLEEVYEVTQGFDFGVLAAYRHTTGELPFNWKLLVDGALEGYHFKIAHAKTIGPYFLDNQSVPLSNTLHSSIVFPKKSLAKLAEQAQENWHLRKVANVLIHLFPNAILLVEPDHIMVVSFIPKSPTVTTYKAFMLLPEAPKSEEKKQYWALNEKIFWDAIDEDNEMAARQQQAFKGDTNARMSVGGFESLIIQFEALVDHYLAEVP